MSKNFSMAHIGPIFIVAALAVQYGSFAAPRKFGLPPDKTTFKKGPGAEVAIGQCLLCHSADYVTIQPPLSRAAWKASVIKMRDKYGAPVAEDKIELLAEYLAKTYGAEKQAGPPQK